MPAVLPLFSWRNMPHKNAEDRRAWAQLWREKNRDKTRAYYSNWKQHPNHKKSRQQAKEKYNQNHPEANRDAGRWYRLRKAGVSEVEIAKAKLAWGDFNGKCQACGGSTTLTGKSFTLDHDHKTLIFRGIPCHWCNVALRQDTSPAILRAIADYLERFQ